MGTFWAGRALAAFVLIALAAFCPQYGWAQATTSQPSAAQVEAFRNLPPDQQQAVLEAMGGQNGAGATRRDPQLATDPNQRALDSRVRSPLPRIGPNGELLEEDQGPPRIQAGSTLILDVKIPEEVRKPPKPTPPPDEAQLTELNARLERINARNPYKLDEQGQLALPSLPPINLSGLTELQASQRLNFDPRLTGLKFHVTLLPVEPIGTAALKPFGYDLFTEPVSTFAPVNDLPVPSDYRLGPGDNVTVELFGKRTGRYLLVVNRNGALTLPEFGPIQVAGMTFDQVRNEIDRRVAEQMIGVRASVTMGELRSIRVFVVGDVPRPGAYTLSSLATITNALFTSGGVSNIGSLRNIELKRGGTTVTRFDLYEMLLEGNTSRDTTLQQGDTIFVPTIGSTAGIAGQVRRPAIYEFRDGATVGELVRLAGGLDPQADSRRVQLERIDADRERTVLELDLRSPPDNARKLMAGDIVTVPKVFDDTRGVTLEGYVHRRGNYAWRQGMRLTELLGSLQIFQINADQRYVLIRRESLPDRRIHVISADAQRAFQQPGTADDPVLHSGDRVIAFSRSPDRGAALADLLDEIRMQARDNEPLPIVSISGRVRAPGDYPLEPNMTVGDLIRAGGGLDEAAYAPTAELTRYVVTESEARKTEVIDLQLSAAASGQRSADVALRAYDVLVVKETPDWRGQESVTLKGEVRFPGSYPIRKGETLRSVIERAGGLTDVAFPKGSVLTRLEIKEQERQQIETLVNRLQSDLALLALQGSQLDSKSNPAETLQAGQSLLTQLQNSQPTGRLVIDLQGALYRPSSEDNIELRGGDELVVPRIKQYVTVIGEVQNPTTHVFKSGLDRNDYILQSGGTTMRADDGRIYVVRANGSVIAPQGPFWFRRGGNAELEPGDTVVVPLDAERMRPLPLWTAVTQIIYHLAVSVAAVNSF